MSAIDTSSIYNATSTASTVTTENDTSLSMTDFFELLVAQLQNQNMLDPVDNSEFISQMAQFSTLSQMQELAGINQMSYAVSLLGKDVTVSSTDDSGNTTIVSGIVDYVYQSDVPYVVIDDYAYPASDVVYVTNAVEAETGDTSATDTSETSSTDTSVTDSVSS